MSILRKALGAEGRAVSLPEMIEHERGGRRTFAGPVVGPESAMRLSAFWRSVNLLSDLVSGFPVDAHRRVGKVRQSLEPQPAIIEDPSADLLPMDWRRLVMVSWLLRGNAVGTVTAADRLGWPSAIELHHPDELTISKSGGRWRYRLGGRERERWPVGTLWHAPAFTVPGSPLGLSPVRYASESVGLGLGVQRFGAQWFGDGAHPTSVVTTEQEVGRDLAKIIKSRIMEALGNRREPAVLGAGLEWKAIQIAPEESQFLETTRANVTDVGRFFGIPAGLLDAPSGDSMTYSNVEQRGLDLLTYTVAGWVLRLEHNLTRLIPRGQYVKLNVDSLARVTLLDRMRAHEIALRNGFRSPNEVRSIEDEAPIPDVDDPDRGDEFLWPPMRSTPLAEGQDARSSAEEQEER